LLACALTGVSTGAICLDILTPASPTSDTTVDRSRVTRRPALNYRPGIPRYLQIAEDIRRELRGEGEQIASEHALCARYKVSRPTVRQALDVLVQEGRIYRHAGRGTFSTAVSGDPRMRVIGSLDDMMALAEENWFKLISREVVRVPPNIAQ